MSQQTLSEKLFEKWCSKAGVGYKRMPEETSRTPDYWIEIGGTRVVVEVKADR